VAIPVLRAPELDAGLQGGSHQSGVEGENPLPRSAGHVALDAAQDMLGFLGCEHTLLAHIQLFIHQYPQGLLSRAALNPFIPQPVLIPGVSQTQVQDVALLNLMRFTQAHFSTLCIFPHISLNGYLFAKKTLPLYQATESSEFQLIGMKPWQHTYSIIKGWKAQAFDYQLLQSRSSLTTALNCPFHSNHQATLALPYTICTLTSSQLYGGFSRVEVTR